jgi:hypothetical protein
MGEGMNLQKLAEKINERWDSVGAAVEYASDYTTTDDALDVSWIRLKSPYVRADMGHRDDWYNAQWIIWCLDRLEELGWGKCFLAWRNDKNLYEVFKSWDDIGGGFTVSEGKTRAEAVTLALAKALGVEDE